MFRIVFHKVFIIHDKLCRQGLFYFNVYGKETRPSNREISFESETVSKTDPKVQFTMDASLTAGSVSVTQSGQSG